MAKEKIIKIILIITLSMGIAGTILFFPIKLDSGNTCMFHSICSKNTEYCSNKALCAENCHLMQEQYLIPFGFIWWTSLVVVVLSSYHIKKSKGE